MAHLVDANCFIQAKNTFYPFDFCPGFWQWIDQQNASGVLFSIDKIKDELTGGRDELAAWAATKDDSFFLPVDTATLQKYTDIVAWVNSAGFKQAVVAEFLRGADPFLIAYALANGHTVVTHETSVPLNQKNKVKIPVVCHQFSVPHITIFDLLRSTGANLII